MQKSVAYAEAGSTDTLIVVEGEGLMAVVNVILSRADRTIRVPGTTFSFRSDEQLRLRTIERLGEGWSLLAQGERGSAVGPLQMGEPGAVTSGAVEPDEIVVWVAPSVGSSVLPAEALLSPVADPERDLPEIESVAPNPVPPLRGRQWITIRGSGFLGPLAATLWDPAGEGYEIPTTAQRTKHESDEIVRVFANVGGDSGTWGAVVDAAGGVSGRFSFEVGQQALKIEEVVPGSLPARDARQYLTIKGEGFHLNASVVLWDPEGVDWPTPRNRTTWVDAETLRILINVRGGPGPWKIVLSNPDGSGASGYFDVE